jgi:hypothetical protein
MWSIQMGNMTGFGRRATHIAEPRSFVVEQHEPTPQQLELAKATFIVADTSKYGFKWRDRARHFAVLSGYQCYGSYATEAEALQRIVELKNP